uniref:Mid2 domain-containing protein n=1 Tax=Panagrellus redivivus TaxID=6233 RepID=A0A7E4VD00_PANRE
MMQPIAKFLMFAAVICFGQAEVKLTQGMNTTVAFEGEELSIRVDNPQKTIGELFLCLKSTSDTKLGNCPEGYAVAHLYPSQAVHTFQLNRQGLVFEMGTKQSIGGKIVFDSNGQLNLILGTITNAMTVTLLNAVIPVITTTTTTTETAQKKEFDKMAMIGIICGVGGLLLFLIVGCMLLYFCWYKKRTHQPIATTVADKERRRAHDDTREIKEPLIPMLVVETPALPLAKRPLKPSATTTTTTRKTTTSTTPASEDKLQVIASKPTPRTPIVQASDLVSLTSDATQMDESVVTPKRKQTGLPEEVRSPGARHSVSISLSSNRRRSGRLQAPDRVDSLLRSEKWASRRTSSHDDHGSRQSETAPQYLRRRTDPFEGRTEGCSRVRRHRPR